MQRRVLVLAFALCGSLAACADPVRSADIDALGGETPGVPAGPLHRAGQPCVLCHDGDGPGEAVFSFGGTVYEDQMHTRPASDVIVHFIDAKKRVHDTATNCAGNFFVMQAAYKPEFPVFVRLQYGTAIVPGKPPEPLTPVDMKTPIYRDGSCATCHVDPPGQDSTGHVFLAPMPINIPNKGCQ
jgi:hypothetical protein